MIIYAQETLAKFMLTNSELATFLQRHPVCSLSSLKSNFLLN